MDHGLFNAIHAASPKFNKQVAEGYAVQECLHVEQYIDAVMQAAAVNFPSALTYHGYERCTPLEEYLVSTRKRSSRQTFDLANTSGYMCKYDLRLRGKPIPSPVYFLLPFVGQAGEIKVRGSSMYVHPVLADALISVSNDSIFVPLNRAKITFRTLTHSFMEDGRIENVFVHWGDIYNVKSKDGKRADGKSGSPRTPLYLYKFCKEGLTACYRQLGIMNPVYVDDASRVVVPPEMVLYQSSNPRNRMGPGVMIPRSELPKTEGDKLALYSLTAALYYLIDTSPVHITPRSYDTLADWQMVLGMMVVDSNKSSTYILNQVERHMYSIGGYIDSMVRAQFHASGIMIDDFYGLLDYIIKHYSTLKLSTDLSSMFGKRLMVLRYLLYSITSSISSLVFALQPHGDTEISDNDILKAIQDKVSHPNKIHEIAKSRHGEVVSVTYPGDCMVFKITNSLILQESATPTHSKSSATSIDDPAKFLHGSLSVAGSLTNLAKKEPTGRNHVNPFVDTLPDGTIYLHPNDAPLINELQSMIARK